MILEDMLGPPESIILDRESLDDQELARHQSHDTAGAPIGEHRREGARE